MTRLFGGVLSVMALLWLVGCDEQALVGEGSHEVAVVAAAPDGDDIPRGSVWSYWDRGGDLGFDWALPTYDTSSWASGAAPLGYGDPGLATTIGYGGDASNKYITTYFRREFEVEAPSYVRSMLAELKYDDGVRVYINGWEAVRLGLPPTPIYASTRADNHEGDSYETYDWLAFRNMLVPGTNVIAVEVHQTAPTSSDVGFDLSLTIEQSDVPPEPTADGVPAGSTWMYWDRGTDPGSDWTAVDFPQPDWSAGAAPLGFGESYLATTTAAGPITTYFRHDFTSIGGLTALALDAMYDDGFIAYLNGTEVLRVGMPPGPVTASTLATGHEATGFQHFDLAAAAPLVQGGRNTLAVEVHQTSATSSDLVWDAALTIETGEPGLWTAQGSGTTQLLTDVWFTDAMHGWVIGDNGTVRRTTDGGATWTAQATGAGTAFLTDIEFADSQHGWIIGIGLVLHTVDGGDSWSVQSTVNSWVGDLSFVSATTGWMAAGSVYRTDDGGETWQLQLAATPYLDYQSVDFVDAEHGWVIARAEGGDGDVNGANVVFHTGDGGLTWQRQLTTGGWEQGLGALAAISPTLAWVGGTGANHTGFGEYKHVTRDGATWEAVADTSNDTALADIHFVDDQLGWACGYAGSIIHTDDGGLTWRPQATARWERNGDHTAPLEPSLYGIHFVDAGTGWAVGAGGTILTTTTGGDLP